VSAIGSESLLRRSRETFAEADREALALSRAWAASGEIEREEVVVQGFAVLRTDELELGVLARWIEGRRFEGGAAGGGVGDASFGMTQERSCLGRAISCASSISALRSMLEELSDEVSHLSLSASSFARVDRVMTRGKLGANVERMRWLKRLDERVGWIEEDSE
jgi:hypothetical protein